jgi:hypothetical protein
MIVYLRVPKILRVVRAALWADGWDIKDLGNGTLAATHIQVGDEDVASARLARLGLLPSLRLHISFEPQMAHCAAHERSVHRPHAHHAFFLHAPTRCL